MILGNNTHCRWQQFHGTCLITALCGTKYLLKCGLATALYPGYCFIPVARIRSRVVYTKDNVNFGRIIGLDTVYIIFPLDL